MSAFTPRRVLLSAVGIVAIGGLAAVSIPAWAGDTATDPSQPSDEPSSQIVGGDFVTNEKPWAAALHSDGRFICSATQINPDWILTAAHCVTEDSDYSVRIGSLQRSDGGEMRDVSTVVSHPDYDDKNEYDIALLELEESYDNSSYVQLAEAEDLGELGQKSIIYGWGRENPDWSGTPSEDLKYAWGNTTDEVCERFEYESMVCFRGEGSAASGDSGGPMFIESDATGDYVQVGVCNVGYNPTNGWTGYTSTIVTSEWIAEVTA